MSGQPVKRPLPFASGLRAYSLAVNHLHALAVVAGQRAIRQMTILAESLFAIDAFGSGGDGRQGQRADQGARGKQRFVQCGCSSQITGPVFGHAQG